MKSNENEIKSNENEIKSNENEIKSNEDETKSNENAKESDTNITNKPEHGLITGEIKDKTAIIDVDGILGANAVGDVALYMDMPFFANVIHNVNSIKFKESKKPKNALNAWRVTTKFCACVLFLRKNISIEAPGVAPEIYRSFIKLTKHMEKHYIGNDTSDESRPTIESYCKEHMMLLKKFVDYVDYIDYPKRAIPPSGQLREAHVNKIKKLFDNLDIEYDKAVAYDSLDPELSLIKVIDQPQTTLVDSGNGIKKERVERLRKAVVNSRVVLNPNANRLKEEFVKLLPHYSADKLAEKLNSNDWSERVRDSKYLKAFQKCVEEIVLTQNELLGVFDNEEQRGVLRKLLPCLNPSHFLRNEKGVLKLNVEDVNTLKDLASYAKWQENKSKRIEVTTKLPVKEVIEAFGNTPLPKNIYIPPFSFEMPCGVDKGWTQYLFHNCRDVEIAEIQEDQLDDCDLLLFLILNDKLTRVDVTLNNPKLDETTMRKETLEKFTKIIPFFEKKMENNNCFTADEIYKVCLPHFTKTFTQEDKEKLLESTEKYNETHLEQVSSDSKLVQALEKVLRAELEKEKEEVPNSEIKDISSSALSNDHDKKNSKT